MRALSKLDQWILKIVNLTEFTRRSPVWLSLLIATFAIFATEVIRILILGGMPITLPTNQYLPFYVIVLLAALCLDKQTGTYATLLSAIVSSAIKGPPITDSVTGAVKYAIELKIDLWPTFGFVFTGMIITLTVEALVHLHNRFKLVADQSEVLIRDLNHRVKNHLSAIASLVNMSKNNVSDESSQILDSVTSRIMVLARLYDRLQLDSDNASVRISANEFIPAICDDLSRTLVGNRLIEIRPHAIPAQITTSNAVPIGLLVNELVTNALKHAFPGGEGEVDVSFTQEQNEYILTVADNGDGGVRGTSGTGSKLINLLVKQLNGQIHTTYDNGRTVRIELPASIISKI